jgi:hypothetical protein
MLLMQVRSCLHVFADGDALRRQLLVARASGRALAAAVTIKKERWIAVLQLDHCFIAVDVCC